MKNKFTAKKYREPIPSTLGEMMVILEERALVWGLLPLNLKQYITKHLDEFRVSKLCSDGYGFYYKKIGIRCTSDIRKCDFVVPK